MKAGRIFDKKPYKYPNLIKETVLLGVNEIRHADISFAYLAAQ